jgi:hypothetical protein
MEDAKLLALTRQEAELLMDSFRVSNPLTRDIALKAASLVLEFAAEDSMRDACDLLDSATLATADAGFH